MPGFDANQERPHRLEGMAKLTGGEPFLDDQPTAGCWWGMTVRSPAPRGRIREIVFEDVVYGEPVDWSKILVVGAADLPGPNELQLIECDMPILADGEVRYVHEPVLLLAHPSRDVLRRAVHAVRIEVDALAPVHDVEAPLSPEQIQRGEDNVIKALAIEKGDVDAAFEGAAHVVEGVYRTGAQEHVYLEPNGMQAWTDGNVLTVEGSMQCPYYVLDAMTHAFGRDRSQVRVIQTATGGGFGGKEDFPSLIAVHTALLAHASGQTVRMVYDRREDMAATTKRHPSVVRHRTGLDATGKLVAQDIDVLMDGGAYVTLSPVVLSRGIIHAAGPYACENVRIRGRTLLSNTVPYGAFRGFGAPQTLFACERHMDVVACAIGMDPVEVRRINLLDEGDSTSTGQVISDGVDRRAVQDRALELARYTDKRAEHASFNAAQSSLRRGIGLATFYHGAGFTGSGEVHLASRVEVAGLADGRVEVLAACTEIGQGMSTTMTRIACDRLGLEPDAVLLARPDTSRVPNSGPTVASRTAMVVGRLVERACDDLRLRLGLAATVRGSEFTSALRAWHARNANKVLVGGADYDPPPEIVWDDASYRGDAYGAFAWATYVAEVEVDLRTFEARVIDFVAVQEIGKVLDDTLARGQIQGGVVQGIGWALTEECVLESGAMKNCQLTNYIIPTSADVPPVRVDFLEHAYEHGAQGAKGIGELPIDGPAPAIANAVADAIGVPAHEIPLTPERLMEAMQDERVG